MDYVRFMRSTEDKNKNHRTAVSFILRTFSEYNVCLRRRRRIASAGKNPTLRLNWRRVIRVHSKMIWECSCTAAQARSDSIGAGKKKGLVKVVADITKVTAGLRLIERLRVVASAGVTPSLRVSERLVRISDPE